jgi:hypothetical protein
MPSARRRTALPRPEVVFLFLPLRPRDTGDMHPMLGPAHHGPRALALPAVTAVADTWVGIGPSPSYRDLRTPPPRRPRQQSLRYGTDPRRTGHTAPGTVPDHADERALSVRGVVGVVSAGRARASLAGREGGGRTKYLRGT